MPGRQKTDGGCSHYVLKYFLRGVKLPHHSTLERSQTEDCSASTGRRQPQRFPDTVPWAHPSWQRHKAQGSADTHYTAPACPHQQALCSPQQPKSQQAAEAIVGMGSGQGEGRCPMRVVGQVTPYQCPLVWTNWSAGWGQVPSALLGTQAELHQKQWQGTLHKLGTGHGLEDTPEQQCHEPDTKG